MKEEEIRALVFEMDTTNSVQAEKAWMKLRDLGQDVVPFLAEAYPVFRKWRGRVALVFHCIQYARSSDTAFQLGVSALQDRATLVRYRACGLLAYSLRQDALPHLKEMFSHQDDKTVEDARAAMDAIKHRNHHYFVDRDHSGRSFWSVNEGDTAEPENEPYSKMRAFWKRLF
jgi:hypothetical protein